MKNDSCWIALAATMGVLTTGGSSKLAAQESTPWPPQQGGACWRIVDIPPQTSTWPGSTGCDKYMLCSDRGTACSQGFPTGRDGPVPGEVVNTTCSVWVDGSWNQALGRCVGGTQIGVVQGGRLIGRCSTVDCVDDGSMN